MKRTTLVCTFATITMLAGCEQKPQAEPSAPKLFEQERDALDKAKEIDAAVEQQAAEMRKKIEDAEK